VDPYRLPRSVVPSRYDIRLEPDLTTLTFRGEETIAVSVAEPVSEIVLNAVELAVDEAVVVDARGAEQRASVSLDETAERCGLAFTAPVAPGAGRLRIRFRGTLNDKLRGFYRSVYKDPGGVTRTMAATQFEATDARRAFPCWDEPAFKAVFSVTLAIDPALTAVSNTRILAKTTEGGRTIVRFADTITMSTYLVAFVVGELEHTEPSSVGDTPLSVWCVPGKRRLAAFGQEIAVASLRYFEDYYGLPYPGDKLDLLAIPDFAAGAMENLGCITFRESGLLVDPVTATQTEEQIVSDTRDDRAALIEELRAERDVAADPASPARDQRRAPGEVEEAQRLHAPMGSSRQSVNQLPIGLPFLAADPIVTCSETRRSVSTMKP